jgi:hypothetical protein
MLKITWEAPLPKENAQFLHQPLLAQNVLHAGPAVQKCKLLKDGAVTL